MATTKTTKAEVVKTPLEVAKEIEKDADILKAWDKNEKATSITKTPGGSVVIKH